MTVTAIILTFDEVVHIARSIESAKQVAQRVFVIDSGSSDATQKIACELGAEVLVNPFVNQATQFNWALERLPDDTEWVLRLDADEFLSPFLINEINKKLISLDTEVNGVFVTRRISFQGSLIRYGGVFPVKVLRLFRYGYGQSENRWMDEHIKVAGKTIDFAGELIDDNLKSLTWWTDKHNKYASREAVDLLNLEYQFMPHDSIASIADGKQASVKRWLKEKIYARLPGGMRAFVYFSYRYFLRLGFLDGQAGTAFHFLQGFWYRYLVDAKVAEVKRIMRDKGLDIKQAIKFVLDINV